MKQTARPKIFSLSTWTWLILVNFMLFNVFTSETRWTEFLILFEKNLLISGFDSCQNDQKFWNLFETLKHSYMESYILQTFQFFSSVHFFAKPKKNCYHFGMSVLWYPSKPHCNVACEMYSPISNQRLNIFNTLVIYF